MSLPLVITSAYLAYYVTLPKVRWGFIKLPAVSFLIALVLLLPVRFDFFILFSLPGENKITKKLQVNNFINNIGCTDLEISKTFGSCDPDYQQMQTETWLK